MVKKAMSPSSARVGCTGTRRMLDVVQRLFAIVALVDVEHPPLLELANILELKLDNFSSPHAEKSAIRDPEPPISGAYVSRKVPACRRLVPLIEREKKSLFN